MKKSPLADNRDPRKIWPNEHFGQGDQGNNMDGESDDESSRELNEQFQLDIADPNWELESDVSDDDLDVVEGPPLIPSSATIDSIEASQECGQCSDLVITQAPSKIISDDPVENMSTNLSAMEVTDPQMTSTPLVPTSTCHHSVQSSSPVIQSQSKKQRTRGLYKPKVLFPNDVSSSSQSSEPRRSSRLTNESSLNLHLSMSSDESSDFSSRSQQPAAIQSVRTANITTPQVHSTTSVSFFPPPAPPPNPSPAVTRSRSTLASSSAPPAPPPNPSLALTQTGSNIPDSTILANIGKNARFSEREKQLLYNINFDAKKMWNKKNLCWMNTSLTGVLYTLEQVDVVLPPPILPRESWNFSDYMADLQGKPGNTTYDARLMIKQILAEFGEHAVGFTAGHDFVNANLLTDQQEIETLFQLFSTIVKQPASTQSVESVTTAERPAAPQAPSTSVASAAPPVNNCPWDCLRPQIEWSLVTEACSNPKCSRKQKTTSIETRTENPFTLSTIPDGRQTFQDKVKMDFDNVDAETLCDNFTCDCGKNCKDLKDCTKKYQCKRPITRTQSARLLESKSGIIFSLPRAKYDANFDWVIKYFLLSMINQFLSNSIHCRKKLNVEFLWSLC